MLDKAIIFDLDGTLWDTSIEIEQVWKEVAENYNIKINQEKIKQLNICLREIVKKEMNLLLNVRKMRINI